MLPGGAPEGRGPTAYLGTPTDGPKLEPTLPGGEAVDNGPTILSNPIPDEQGPIAMLATQLTPDDFKVKPDFKGGDVAAKERVWEQTKEIVDRLADKPQVAKRTTFAVAEIEKPDGTRETWMAGAGAATDSAKAVPRQFRVEGAEMKNNLHPDATPDSHLNDAEGKLIRQAAKEGVEIKAMGATREMCPVCQEAANAKPGVLDTMVTPLEESKP